MISSDLTSDWERCCEVWRQAGCVRSGEVDPTMHPSEEHLLCEWFAEHHPDSAEFLFSQLHSPDPYLAAYAFKCLLRVQEPRSEDLPPEVLQRTELISTLWGCVARTQPLGNFIRGYFGLDDPEPPRVFPPRRHLP